LPIAGTPQPQTPHTRRTPHLLREDSINSSLQLDGGHETKAGRGPHSFRAALPLLDGSPWGVQKGVCFGAAAKVVLMLEDLLVSPFSTESTAVEIERLHLHEHLQHVHRSLGPSRHRGRYWGQ